MKIGVFVGSFDPVHIGHENIANYLINEKIVDKVIIIATGNYWEKQNITDLKTRLEMLALIKNDNIIIDNKYNNLTYTYEILNSLRKDNPEDTFYLVIGADNANTLYKWKRYEDILKNKIIVVNRNNIPINLTGDNIIVINKTFGDVSSTKIRNNVLDSKVFLDEKVYNYIVENKLYKKEGDIWYVKRLSRKINKK